MCKGPETLPGNMRSLSKITSSKFSSEHRTLDLNLFSLWQNVCSANFMIYSCRLFSLVILDTGWELLADKILESCNLPFIITGKACSANARFGKMTWRLPKPRGTTGTQHTGSQRKQQRGSTKGPRCSTLQHLPDAALQRSLR